MVIQTEQVKKYYKYYFTNKVTIRNPLRVINFQNISKENLILAVGRLEKEKGYDELLNAFANISSDWYLEIISEGSERKYLQNLIVYLGLNNKVRLIGAVKNVDDYFNRAQIFVMTSKHEGYPNALCEAMAFKLACISYDCPFGPSEIIKNGYNVILVEPGNVHKLSESIQNLILNGDYRKLLAQNAVSITDSLNINVIMYNWEQVIHQLI